MNGIFRRSLALCCVALLALAACSRNEPAAPPQPPADVITEQSSSPLAMAQPSIEFEDSSPCSMALSPDFELYLYGPRPDSTALDYDIEAYNISADKLGFVITEVYVNDIAVPLDIRAAVDAGAHSKAAVSIDLAAVEGAELSSLADVDTLRFQCAVYKAPVFKQDSTAVESYSDGVMFEIPARLYKDMLL